jgi:hypothetical protein
MFQDHPIAVLVDINAYEEQFSKPKLVELHKNKVDKNIKKQAAVAKKSKKTDLINIQ